MKNFRFFLAGKFLLVCFGIFAVTSCADNVIVPSQQEVSAIQKNAKTSEAVLNVAEGVANRKNQQSSDHINNFGVLRAILSLQQATASAGSSVTIQFGVSVYSPDGDDSFSVDLYRTVTDMSGNIVSGPIYFGSYTPGTYSATSPMGLPSGTYSIRISSDSPVANSNGVTVTIP